MQNTTIDRIQLIKSLNKELGKDFVATYYNDEQVADAVEAISGLCFSLSKYASPNDGETWMQASIDLDKNDKYLIASFDHDVKLNDKNIEQIADALLYLNEEAKAYLELYNFNVGTDKDKLNNYELAALNLKPHLEAISSYTATYLPNEPKATKIKRQIKALESIIKN